MARVKYSVEQIIHKLREAEVLIGQGQTVKDICRKRNITDPTYYRWRQEYGRLKLDQAKRLKDLERENTRLKGAVADLTLDKLILKQAAEGNF
jgi:transposase-like protein